MRNLIQFRREMWGLDKNLFTVQPPEPLYQGRVFTGREEEFGRASISLRDAPRNILVSGLFGVGKTIFIRELLDELQQAFSEEMLTTYGCLDTAKSDLATTILSLLANALQEEDEKAREIAMLLDNIEFTIQETEKGGSGGEVNFGIAKFGGTGEKTTAQTRSRKVVSNAPNQIRELVHRATERHPDRRLVVAVDDLDKLDPATAREMLVEARSVLHTNCAFVFTGHPLGVLRNIYSTAGGIFDTLMYLEVMSGDDLRQMMLNYLEAGRVLGATQSELFPFTEEAAEVIITRSLGLPRQLNRIAYHILQKAAELRRPIVDLVTLYECWQGVAKDLHKLMSEDTARLVEIIREQTGGFDPTQVPDQVYERLGVDSHQELFAKISNAMSGDMLVSTERDGQQRLSPGPFLEQFPNTPLLPPNDAVS